MAGLLDIQRQPRGLLDALGLKGSGATPFQLAPQIAATYELRELYAQELRRQLDFTMTAYANGLNWFAGTTVPSGELWIVTNATLFVNNGAGVSSQAALAYNPTPAASTTRIISPYTSFAASTAQASGVEFGFGELILTPGMALGIYALAVVGVPTLASIAADYYRFTV